MSYKQLLHIARICSPALGALQALEIISKREFIMQQSADLGELVDEYKSREKSPHPTNPHAVFVDDAPRRRLAYTAEALIATFYTLADVAAQFFRKVGDNQLPSSFNKLCNDLEKGKPAKAAKELHKFVKKVNKLIKNGKLSQTDGQSLIDAANAVINQLT